MPTSARKTREIHERERLFLLTAMRIVETEGFHALTLGRLAEMSEYSKGTVYNHFSCREDLLLRLGTEYLEQQLECLTLITERSWTPQERVYALALSYLAHASHVPVLFECAISGNTHAVRQRASSQQLSRRAEVDAKLVELVADRILAGDVPHSGGLEGRQALDALRCYLFGHLTMHVMIPSTRWAKTLSDSAQLTALGAVVTGLGFAPITLRRARAILKEVDPVTGSVVDRRSSLTSTSASTAQ